MYKENSSSWNEIKIIELENTLDPNPRKLRLLADQNIPIEIIDELKSAKFQIVSVAEIGLSGHPDENIREYAKKKNRVILTSDKDFWDERKHPIRKCFGIICTESGPQDFDKLIESLARFNHFFAKYFSNDLWYNMKALIKTHGFILRQLNFSKIDEKEFYFDKGRIYERVLK
jgi:predicted nuclease of predicted toxin-antitoxin system